MLIVPDMAVCTGTIPIDNAVGQTHLDDAVFILLASFIFRVSRLAGVFISVFVVSSTLAWRCIVEYLLTEFRIYYLFVVVCDHRAYFSTNRTS